MLDVGYGLSLGLVTTNNYVLKSFKISAQKYNVYYIRYIFQYFL